MLGEAVSSILGTKDWTELGSIVGLLDRFDEGSVLGSPDG